MSPKGNRAGVNSIGKLNQGLCVNMRSNRYTCTTKKEKYFCPSRPSRPDVVQVGQAKIFTLNLI